MSFADNLMELRKLNNLSQEEIAEKIGVSRRYTGLFGGKREIQGKRFWKGTHELGDDSV